MCTSGFEERHRLAAGRTGILVAIEFEAPEQDHHCRGAGQGLPEEVSMEVCQCRFASSAEEHHTPG